MNKGGHQPVLVLGKRKYCLQGCGFDKSTVAPAKGNVIQLTNLKKLFEEQFRDFRFSPHEHPCKIVGFIEVIT